MTWRQSRRLKLFWLLWIPAACFGQNSGGGSRIESNPLSVYAPPCISQVKENIGVQCQVTPKGGYATVKLWVYWRLPNWHVDVYRFGRWLDQWYAYRDKWQ